ncbi:hypothetical protein [Alteromonas sp. 14N.309.X.WAT.G.H12]|uniref:hypothetical protein n=1 Tax=Alteromonas sp. 14N.309.X.WAT.G.H12 TaxID=3120824 RepID=UPI002FD23288
MKKLIIHVGPPKSGTSAIQKWLSENRDLLVQQGFFYPKHNVDDNGVSSGNVFEVFEEQKDKSLTISTRKVDALFDVFRQSGCHTLLLSSEFFFRQINVLSDAFPQAVFLAYLRFPLDVIESSYNQGIKRHGETRALGLPAKPRSYQLETLEKNVSSLGEERFILLPYHRECFVKQNLVCDFLHNIGIDLTPQLLARINNDFVNTSYTLESLEFKRWLNQFDIEPIQHQLDGFLQSLRVGKTSYSLIPPKRFATYQVAFVDKLTDFCQKYSVTGGDKFISLCQNLRQKEYMKQEIDDERFQEILIYFVKNRPDSFRFLQKLFYEESSSDVEKYPQRVEMVNQLLSGQLKYAYFRHKLLNDLRKLFKWMR